MIFTRIDQLIGNTPMLRLERLMKAHRLQAELVAKLESFNPAGSTKDRVASAMIDDAEWRGLIHPGDTLIEPTSGNTGIGLAAMAAPRGYRVILTMPDTMSMERRRLLAAYGAEVVLTDGKLGMQGAIARAKELLKEIEGSYMPSQFDNPANPQAHRDTTGPEIWKQTEGKMDVLVATVGTGGTITGVSEYLKAQNPNIHVAAVEPQASPLLSGGKAGPHGIQGIGANFIPCVLNTGIYDEIIQVSDEEAYAAGRELAKTEGILAGISSGAALHAAMQVAKRPVYANKRIVVLLPDTGERYLSSDMFSEK